MSGAAGPTRGRDRPDRLALLGLLLALLAACSGEPRSRLAPSALLVVMDAASARHLSLYGASDPTTPALEELGRQSTVFERAYAQAPATLASAYSYFTGRYPPSERRRGGLQLQQPLAERLSRAGLRTAAFSENPYVSRRFGFDRGFELFTEYFPPRLLREKPGDYGRPDTSRTIDEVGEWLRARADERFFAYVHLLPPHAPYDPPPPFAGRYSQEPGGRLSDLDGLLRADRGRFVPTADELSYARGRYRENLAWADHQVGRLVAAIDAIGRGPDTLLIVASDHGEAFLEHGRLLHGSTLYEEMIHVPLLIRFPAESGIPAGRFGGVVELIDLLPTVCDVLGVPTPEPVQGQSLLPSLRSGNVQGEGVARSFAGRFSHAGTSQASLVDGDRKLIFHPQTGEGEYYELDRDPGERRNRAAERTSEVAQLRRALEAIPVVRVEVEEGALDETTRERLEALGYVAED